MNAIILCISYGYVLFGVMLVLAISILLGLIPIRLFKITLHSSSMLLLHSFWIGYALFISLLLLVNIFLPITIFSVSIFLLPLCICSLLLNKKVFAQSSLFSIKNVGILLLIVGLAVLFFRSKFYGDYGYDIYWYHFPLLRLANEFPTIKGVVNIFNHYGNTYLTSYHGAFLAIFNLKGWFSGYILFVIPTTYAAVLFLFAYKYIQEHVTHLFLKHNFLKRFAIIFTLIAIMVCINYPLSSKNGTGPGVFHNNIPDINYYILGLIYLICFVYFLANPNKLQVLVLVSISLVLVFTKLSAIFFVLTIISIATAYWFYKTKNIVFFIQLLLYSLFLLIPYCIVSVLKTGALFFPISFTDLHMPWSNNTYIKEYAETVLGWARESGANYILYKDFNVWGWLPSWLNKNKGDFAKIFIWYAISVFLLLRSKRYTSNEENNNAKHAWVIFWVFATIFIANILFWFLSAPNVRFAGVLFLLPIIVLFSLYFTRVGSYIHNMHITKNKLAILLVCLMGLTLFSFNIFTKVLLLMLIVILLLYFTEWGARLPLTLNTYIRSWSTRSLVIVNKKMRVIVYIILLFNILLILDNSRIDRRILLETGNTSSLVLQEHQGVTIYSATGDFEYLCGYTNNIPCITESIHPDYTWIDKTAWYKGLIHK